MTLSKSSQTASTTLIHFLSNPLIPPNLLPTARGIAIFTTLRLGAMYVAGSSGTGVLLARLSSGVWSAPSAISVKSASVGFMGGLDYCEVVVLLMTEEAVKKWSAGEVVVGGKAGVTGAEGKVGGVKGLGKGETKGEAEEVKVFTRSRGVYGGFGLEGTVVKEKKAWNEEVYGKGTGVREILGGDAGIERVEKENARGLKDLVDVLNKAVEENVKETGARLDAAKSI